MASQTQHPLGQSGNLKGPNVPAVHELPRVLSQNAAKDAGMRSFDDRQTAHPPEIFDRHPLREQAPQSCPTRSNAPADSESATFTMSQAGNRCHRARDLPVDRSFHNPAGWAPEPATPQPSVHSSERARPATQRESGAAEEPVAERDTPPRQLPARLRTDDVERPGMEVALESCDKLVRTPVRSYGAEGLPPVTARG